LDVLVIGGGACGLAAAITAHDAGLTTAILEKRDRPGGNSALSTGSVAGAGSKYQKRAGINDSAEAMYADLMNVARETDDPELVRRLTGISASIVEWLIEEVGTKIDIVTAYKHIGHSVSRLHAPVSRRGADLVDDLLSAVEKRGISLAVGNAAKDLIVEDGAVMGAIVDSGKSTEEVRAKKTILAVNGYAGNAELVKRYCPEIAGAHYFGALGSTGEAVIWGEKLGAAFGNMEAYQGYPAIAYPEGSILSWTVVEKGGFMVGADAKRFGDESSGYSGYASVVLKQGGQAYVVFDQKMFDVGMGEEEFVALWERGGVKKANDIAGLAAVYGLDAKALAEELAAFNAAASGKAKDRFGRTDFGLAPLAPPFYVGRVIPALFHTQGGLRVDSDARVLRKDGKPIPNLFAGGGAACGISGKKGAFGYASGNGLLSAIGLGRIGALAAAREIVASAR
jgi:fumarate reductase flavoprotein subunit